MLGIVFCGFGFVYCYVGVMQQVVWIVVVFWCQGYVDVGVDMEVVFFVGDFVVDYVDQLVIEFFDFQF